MLKQKIQHHKLDFLGILVFCFFQGLLRYNSRELVNVSANKYTYREFDPRGRSVETYRKRSEREFFKIKGQFLDSVSWPGLSALDFSLTWLRVLVSSYEEASVEGDFSWLFHKMRFISHMLPKEEDSFQTAMLPFFVVLGKDPAGALFLLNEKISKYKSSWRVSYWAGFHALENLHEKKLAGSYFLEAAKYPNCPPYLAALGVRLLQGTGDVSYRGLRAFAIKNLDPELLEKLKSVRPEWFILGEK